jgi:hypothetical protein
MAKAGPDASHPHLDLLAECAEACRETAHQLIAGSGDFSRLLSTCAEVCDRCGAESEQVDGMEECGAVCRWCAEACRALAS